jgi:hypothetical protein
MMKLTEKENTSVHLTFIVCMALIVVSVVASITIYNLNDRNNMAKNIDVAIQRGIDPISVKCAYESSATGTCIAYSLSQKR